MNKPDWKDAPEWAQWLACDHNGCWWWWEYEPEIEGLEWISEMPGEGMEYAGKYFESNISWLATLERRP